MQPRRLPNDLERREKTQLTGQVLEHERELEYVSELRRSLLRLRKMAPEHPRPLTEVGGSCLPGALRATDEGARVSAAEVSTGIGLVLTKTSANLKAIS